MGDVTVDVLIIGAGFSGICMGIQLRKAGMDLFLIIEKSDEIGGTWWDNRYPGCACDIPSHLYSFSFDPSPEWSRMYPRHLWPLYCASANHRVGPGNA